MSEASVKAALKAHIGVNQEWLAQQSEPIVEPDLQIVDPHHHLWDMPGSRYLYDDVRADFESGHNIVGSVHVTCHSMYRADGPQSLRCVGETEFVNGMAAQSASGEYGPTRICAGIVGAVDLMLGAQVEPVLEAHIRAGGDRFRGVRPLLAWHESADVRVLDIQPHVLREPVAREAIASIAKFGLTLDVWMFFTQLDEAIEVCRAFPELTVIVNHCGGPVHIGPHAGKDAEVFEIWRHHIRELSACPNAIMKIGGLAMRYAGFAFNTLPAPPSSDLMAQKWQPYIDECIEQFGPSRCMFESNFPVDRGMCNFGTLWNAFKKATVKYSKEERECLFSRTAISAYHLAI